MVRLPFASRTTITLGGYLPSKLRPSYPTFFIDGRVKFIHVAGTKGKGTTCEYIAAAMRAAGIRVGVFTSPHLHTARERVKIGHEIISRHDLQRLGKEALLALSDSPWSVFFDIFLLTALKYFGEKKVEYIILESGIGGRYDSTNFIEEAAACIITSISLDHQAILGETLDKIAWQKAGIIKPGCPVFTPATQRAIVLDVLRKESTLLKSPLFEVKVSRELLRAASRRLEESLSYPVQVENACLAMAVLDHLKIPRSEMIDFFWPCRMETHLVRGTPVVLDGCHNGYSVQLFLEGVKQQFPGYKVLTLFGGGMEKCLDDMLREVGARSDYVMFVQSRHFKAVPEVELEEQLQPLLALSGSTAKLFVVEPSERVVTGTSSVGIRLQHAIDNICSSLRHNGEENVVVCICGSLFAAAEGREVVYSWSPKSFSESDWVKEVDDI